MSNRYWTVIVVFAVALGVLLWGLSLHPDEAVAREVLVTPYVAKGLGVIGLIGSMILFLVTMRRRHRKDDM